MRNFYKIFLRNDLLIFSTPESSVDSIVWRALKHLLVLDINANVLRKGVSQKKLKLNQQFNLFSNILFNSRFSLFTLNWITFTLIFSSEIYFLNTTINRFVAKVFLVKNIFSETLHKDYIFFEQINKILANIQIYSLLNDFFESQIKYEMSKQLFFIQYLHNKQNNILFQDFDR